MFSGNVGMTQNDPNLQVNDRLSRAEIENFDFRQEGNMVFLHSVPTSSGIFELNLNGESHELNMINGKVAIDQSLINDEGLYYITLASQSRLLHISQNDGGKYAFKNIPLWLSIVPPLLAIIIALIFKEVILALFIGIWSGAFIANGFDLSRIFTSFFRVIDKYILQAVSDSDHMSVILFSLLIGGMVALISKNGGMQGVVNALSKYARTPRSAQFTTWLMGVAIFFDDYANTLIVGNTMRSVTDKFKISREKLAYIVDSTAAPVSAVAFITTWIGAELGYIDDGISRIDLGMTVTPYAVFLASLKYSFYPILTLIFMLILIHQKKDFGPMLKAERRARSTGQVSSASTEKEDEPDMEDLSPVANAPMKWWHAVVPVLTVIIVTIIGLLVTGFNSLKGSLMELERRVIYDSWSVIWNDLSLLTDRQMGFFSKLGTVIGASNSYEALLWSSLLGVVVALLISVFSRTMKLIDASHWMVAGFKSMLPALIILCLAWALAITTDELKTAEFISSSLEGNLNPLFLPAIIFVLAAFIAFSTGSSWSTMAILYPIAIPTAFAVSTAAGIGPELTYEILLCCIATVLGASVLGDHCSPISDTTILSSLASDCNHMDHVRTQFPYAILVGSFSIVGITLAIFLGGGGFICFILIVLCILALFFIVKSVGKYAEESVM